MTKTEGMRLTPGMLFVAGALALMMTLAATFAMPGEAHALKAAGGAKVFTLKMQNVDRVGPDEYNDTKVTARAEYKDYDLTGDGKRDVLKVVANGSEYTYEDSGEVEPYFDSVAFYVNGKKALVLKYNEDDSDATKFKFQIVQLKNKKQFLLIDGSALYRYKSGKMCEALSAFAALNASKGKYCWSQGVAVKSVKGNTVTATMSAATYSLGVIRGDFKYTYKNGSFKRTTNSAPIRIYMATRGSAKDKKQPTVKATKRMAAYKNANCKSKKFTIKKGQKVKFLKMYGKGSVFSVQVKSGGKTGWIKMATKWNSPLLNKTAPPFENLFNV